MKKFLSLLLAMTMVMSLIVLPARASENPDKLTMPSSVQSPTRGDSNGITITATAPSNASDYSALNDKTGYTPGDHPTWSWTASPAASVELTNANQAEVTVKGKVAGQVTLTCNYSNTWSKSEAADVIVRATGSVTITVTDAILASDIKTVTFKGRPASINSAGKVVYYTIGDETAQVSDFAFTSDSYSNIQVSGTVDSLTLTSGAVTGTLQTEKKSASVTLSNPTNPTISKNTTGCGTTSITATCNGFTAQGYTWYDGETAIDGANSATLNWTPATTAADGNHTIKCVVKYGSAENQKIDSDTKTVTIENKTYDIRAIASTTTPTLGYVVASNNQSASFPSINLYDVTTASAPVAVSPAVTFSYSEVSDPSNAVSVNPSTGAITVTGSGTATLRATTSYKGKNYSKDLIVYASALMADFDRQAWYNSPATYYYSDLVTAANKALSTGNTYGSNYYGTVYTIQTVNVNNNSLGTSTNTLSYGAQSGSITFTPYYNARGKAPVTVTLTTTTGKPVTVTLNIPVVPIPRTFDSLTAEPVTTNYTTSINNYRITFPSTYSTYYVVQKNGTTAPDYATVSLGNPYSAGSQYTLSSADFGTNGTCTLYVIATNNYTYGSSYGMYYSGAITVTQTNYNINYNGVAGETVQFAQSDFNDFMNEVAEARGDASKTKSYPYVTFDYVTFSLPTTAQGTLYYGGTAMSTSNSSGAFNTRTKVTNLDSVTFVPNAKTTAKTITLNFTLYATRYSSSSTSLGTTVPYSGSVVVNLVREDIKYTVSQGDSVRFDESDFLSYLRSTKGYTSNYTIDYVTFDQSAVSAVNEGSLYTYYNGYNYGGSVKTTDKFYYSATASQNALSDVAFLASRYAKTGETVYIPFTIYARYGSTGTGTRQLTGTVAIKIGQTMNFIDVKTTDYFYNSVKWAVGKNITNGTSSTTFSPYKSCTRAEIVTFLWRAAGSPEPTITRNPFRDVNAVTHSSYYKAILWASQKGITSGTSATAFSPDQVCTRAQIVTFLYRYAGQPSGYYSNPFKDVGATSEASYYNAILWAVGKGITTGTSATTFSPYASCNRAEAVTFLYRYTNGL